MLEDRELRELELVNEEGELLFTPWVLDERSLMAGYEAAGIDAMKDRFSEWIEKVKAWWKKVDVMNTASIKKLELTVNNQAKQWDTVKNDVAGKEPYKIEVTKTNFLMNSQGLSWYTDQLKKMDSWTDNVYKAVPEFRKAVVAALSAAKEASDVSGVQSAMGTLTTALSTYYTAVGNNIPEMAPITVSTGDNKASIQKKSQDAVNQAVGKYYFADKTTASLGPEWCGSAVSAIQPFPSVGKKIFDRVKSSIADWDREIGNAKNQIKGVLDKYSDQKQKQTAAKAMSTFMKSVKEGMKVDQQINSLMGKNLSSAHATSGVLGKALNHFASGGKNKESQKTEGEEQKQGNEMFTTEDYYFDHTDAVLEDLINLSALEVGYEELEPGMEFFLWDWTKKFFKWLGSLFGSSEEKAAENYKNELNELIEQIKNEVSTFPKNADGKPVLLTKTNHPKLVQRVFTPNTFGKINPLLKEYLPKIKEGLTTYTERLKEVNEKIRNYKASKNWDINQMRKVAEEQSVNNPNSAAWKFIQEVCPIKAANFVDLKKQLSPSGLLMALDIKQLTEINEDTWKKMATDAINNKIDVDFSSEYAEIIKQINIFEKATDDIEVMKIKNPSPEEKETQQVILLWFKNATAMFSAATKPVRTYLRIGKQQTVAMGRIVAWVINSKNSAKEEPAKESFSSQLIGSELAADLYSDEVLEETLKMLEERSRYLETREYLGYGTEGFFSKIAEWIDKLIDALKRLFGFGGNDSSSVEKREKEAKNTEKKIETITAKADGIVEQKGFDDFYNQLDAAFAEVAKTERTQEQIAESNRLEKKVKEQKEWERANDERQKKAEKDEARAKRKEDRDWRKVRNWVKQNIQPIINPKEITLEIPESFKTKSRVLLTDKTYDAFRDVVLDVLPQSRLYKELPKMAKTLGDYVSEFGRIKNSNNEKQSDELVKDVNAWLQSFDTDFNALNNAIREKIAATDQASGLTMGSNGRIRFSLDRKLGKYRDAVGTKQTGSFADIAKSIRNQAEQLSNRTVRKSAKIIENIIDEVDFWGDQLINIRDALRPIKDSSPNAAGKAINRAANKFVGKAAIVMANLAVIKNQVGNIGKQAASVIHAWDAAYRTALQKVKKQATEAIRKSGLPQQDLDLLKKVLRWIRNDNRSRNNAITHWMKNSLRLVDRCISKYGVETLGERDPFWFLDAPHISDEKAIEMFEQLISEETEDKIQKQVENLDENNEEGYNPDAGADMAIEIAGLENQLKVFTYGDLQAGQEGFFDAAMRLLTSLADMVSRLFSTFKLVYRSFQGLKRTEYQSYKEKYAATLLRVKRQSFTDIAEISVPHPKGLQVKYIDVLEKLLATLQACDMPARSKGFAVTAKNLRNQLEDGVSTEGTVGALFMQAGEVDRIRKMWEDSEKCFKGSGNTAEFKTLYSSMEEFNRVLDRVDDAAHYEYDVSKVYSNLNDCNDYLQSAVRYAKTRKAGEGIPISKAELVSLSEACLFMAKTFDVYGLTIQLENRVQHNVVEDIKTIVRSKKL